MPSRSSPCSTPVLSPARRPTQALPPPRAAAMASSKEAWESMASAAMPAILFGAADCSMENCFLTSSRSSSSRVIAARRSASVMSRVASIYDCSVTSDLSQVLNSLKLTEGKVSRNVFREVAQSILSLGGEPFGVQPSMAMSFTPAPGMLPASSCKRISTRQGTASSRRAATALKASSREPPPGKTPPEFSRSPFESTPILTARGFASPSTAALTTSSMARPASVAPIGTLNMAAAGGSEGRRPSNCGRP
mmetsp:Transcript_28986/g.73561  ORF Transcript_28986/g.73561 Transcript_28986/m.73561 type:complete len:250 (-) Transcript_28986:23-772(-)